MYLIFPGKNAWATYYLRKFYTNSIIMKLQTFFVLTAIALISTSCISKKDYEAVLAQHEVDKQGFENRIAILDRQILNQDQTIDTLSLNLANKKGANTALVATQDRLLDRIDEVQAQLEGAQKDKSSTSQSLSSTVRAKEDLIKERDAKIAAIQAKIIQFEENQQTVLGNLSYELEQLFGDKQSVDYVNDEIRITLDESLLFRPGSARVRTAGIQNLEKIAQLIEKDPTLKLTVIGNTDNKKAKNYKDNWDYSVIRAANVVKVLTKEYELPPSRVLAAGKGEFAPKASNQTSEGQAKNRRIDFVILPRFDRVVKDIKKELKTELKK